MDSNIEWRKWGEKDPLYAVATWPGKERHGPNAWTDEQFYRLGESDWADSVHHWEHYGMLQDHCVEIGCGAGRITKQLATAFRKVTALDISPHQLDYAKSRITAENVSFVLTAGLSIPLENASCSAAFSTHVFQHLNSHSEAYAIFREIHRVLQAGGTMMVHLPAYHLPDMPVSAAFRPVISLIKRIGDFRANINRRLLLRGQWRFVMRRLRFERPELTAVLQKMDFTEIEFRFFPVRSNNNYHEFVLAKKGGH